MSSRLGFRAAGNFNAFRTAFRQTFSRRWQSSTTTAEEAVGIKKENMNPFSWSSPVGPKTVHFWAPVMKWVLVGVSISDFARPADQLSLTQSAALTATGAIWTRWCLIIKPRNVLLAAVNFFLFLANGYQVGRIVNLKMNSEGKTVEGEAKAIAQDVQVKATEAKDAVKKAVSK